MNSLLFVWNIAIQSTSVFFFFFFFFFWEFFWSFFFIFEMLGSKHKRFSMSGNDPTVGLALMAEIFFKKLSKQVKKTRVLD